MKRTFKFFAAALAIVAAASCAKETVSNDNSVNDEPQKTHMIFSATLESDSNPDSKTTLADDGVSVHWTAGDQILLIPDGAYKGDTFSIKGETINGAFAQFEGDAVDAESYTAVYPANVYNNNTSDIGLVGLYGGALSVQYAVPGNFSQGNRSYNSTNIAISTTSRDGNLYFKNINSHLKFKLNYEGVYSIEVCSDKVTYNNSGELSDNGDLGSRISCDVSDPNELNIYLIENVTISFKQRDNIVPLESDTEYYIAIPAVEIEGLTLITKDKDGQVISTYKKQSTFESKSNTIYNLGTLEYVAPPAKVGDYFYTDGTYSTGYDSSKILAGIVFYVGDGMKADETLMKDYPSCTHGLVVATTSANKTFATKTGHWLNSEYMSTEGYTANTGRNDLSYLMTGYNNTKVLSLYHTTAPASLEYIAGLTAVSNASTWFIPSCAEFDALYVSWDEINNSLSSIGYVGLMKQSYCTSTKSTYKRKVAVFNAQNNPVTVTEDNQTNTYPLLPIFAF